MKNESDFEAEETAGLEAMEELEREEEGGGSKGKTKRLREEEEDAQGTAILETQEQSLLPAPIKRKRQEEPPKAPAEHVVATSLRTGERVRVVLRSEHADEEFVARARREAEEAAIPGRSERISAILQSAASKALREKEQREAEAAQQTGRKRSGDLLVSQYSPQAYTDLITDEKMNREVLAWLNSWKKPRTAAAEMPWPAVVLAGPPSTGKTSLVHVLARQAGYNVIEINASDVRTTEAFGQAVEDAVSFTNVLPGGKPNMLLIDEIDGIAGADGKGAIDVLVKMLAASAARGPAGEKRQKPGTEGSDGEDEVAANEEKEDPLVQQQQEGTGKRRRGKKKKKEKRVAVVRRPIICTCNDLYVPALRQLRTIAQVFTVNKPSPQRFVSAIKRICAAEGIQADGAAVTALCEVSQFDIRSALNALEFASSLPGATVTREALQRAAVGEKDAERSIFDIWRAILLGQPLTQQRDAKSPAPARRSGHAQQVHPPSASPAARPPSSEFDELHAVIDATGSWEKVLDGCWLNYARLGFPDHTMTKTIECTDWICHADCLLGRAQGHTPWAGHSVGQLASMASPAALSFRSLGMGGVAGARWAAPRGDTVSYPRAHGVMWKHRRDLSSIASSFLDAMPPARKSELSRGLLETEFLPHFLTIIAPAIRPLNRQLMNQADRNILSKVADDMLSYGLKYRHESGGEAADGGLSLDPPVQKLVQYGGPIVDEAAGLAQRPHWMQQQQPEQQPATPSFTVARRVLTPQQRKLVSQELQTEQWRRREESNAAAVSRIPSSQPLKSLVPKELPKISQPPAVKRKDFFGRPIEDKPEVTAPPTTSQKKRPSPIAARQLPAVRFRFQEGFTNAVRRKLFIADLL